MKKRLKLRGWVKVVMIILIVWGAYATIIDVNNKLNNKYQIEQEKINQIINIKEEK